MQPRVKERKNASKGRQAELWQAASVSGKDGSCFFHGHGGGRGNNKSYEKKEAKSSRGVFPFVGVVEGHRREKKSPGRTETAFNEG